MTTFGPGCLFRAPTPESEMLPSFQQRVQTRGETLMLHLAEVLLQELIAYVRKAELQQDILSRYGVVAPADERNQPS